MSVNMKKMKHAINTKYAKRWAGTLNLSRWSPVTAMWPDRISKSSQKINHPAKLIIPTSEGPSPDLFASDG